MSTKVMTRQNEKNRNKIRTMAQIGMLSAIATVLMLFEIPLPFAPSFYEIDFSEVPILIGSFAMGPLAGAAIELIKILESKLTAKAFAKEQRNLMTTKLREHIKARDNFTCCICGNSIQKEPNLLLEIDHIIPVSKGGKTLPENLQTLCWRCNRSKSDKLIS